MPYVDLGKYSFTTGQDYTGLNTGNLTSILPLHIIRIPYFEMYRLVIDTSTLSSVTPIPVIVQDSGLVTGTSLTTLNVTLNKAATVGNTLVAVYGSFGAAANPTVTGITIGANADHWGVVGTAGSTSTDSYATVWADPNGQQASSAIVITSGSGSGATWNAARVWELSGMFSTTTPASALDVGSSAATTGGSLSSFPLNPGITTAANDFAVGIGMFNRSGAGNINPVVPAPWTSAYGSASVAGGFFEAAATSYGFAGPKGSSFNWSATTSGNVGAAAAQADFLASATPVTAPSFPFTVTVDNQQYDMQNTAAGTGYTYAVGQSPLYLRNSQNLQILWTSLPYATYATYAPALRCTAYFRYDPAAQQSGNVAGHA